MTALRARLSAAFRPKAPSTTAAARHHTAFRPGHVNDIYGTKGTTGSTNTGHDSMIMAHVDLHTARDANLDPALQGDFNDRLLKSNDDLLTALRAENADDPLSDYVSETVGDYIKQLEEERAELLENMNSASDSQRRRLSGMIFENRDIQDQLQDYKVETEELQNYRQWAQQRIADLEQRAHAYDSTDDTTVRMHDHEQQIMDLTGELESANNQLVEGQKEMTILQERQTSLQQENAVLREQNTIIEQHLVDARTKIDKLHKRRWF